MPTAADWRAKIQELIQNLEDYEVYDPKWRRAQAKGRAGSKQTSRRRAPKRLPRKATDLWKQIVQHSASIVANLDDSKAFINGCEPASFLWGLIDLLSARDRDDPIFDDSEYFRPESRQWRNLEQFLYEAILRLTAEKPTPSEIEAVYRIVPER